MNDQLEDEEEFEDEAAKQSATDLFHPPQDLWRGWVNPANGIVPEKLGV